MQTETEKDENYEKVVFALNQTICQNLKELLKARGLSQRKFCKIMANEKVSITRAHFNKILKNPNYISAAFLLSCCDYFGVTLHNLVSTDFDASEYIYNDTDAHKEYLNIKKLLQTYENTQKVIKQSDIIQDNIMPEVPSSNLLSWFNDGSLITDPSNILFDGYIQDYFCYYYPTNSAENKVDENILKGILHLKAEGQYCHASLTINTNTLDDDGYINYKKYSGYAVISPTVHSLNCIMYSDSLCEFCFLMFRHFKLNFGKQDCRIAEVLSSSSAAEERRPTVLRMLCSKERIKDEDLKVVTPAFLLNYSTIVISEEDLAKVTNDSDIYQTVVASLIESTIPQSVYFFKEDDVAAIARKHLKTKVAALEFIMNLRAASYAYKYNKVSKKADDAVREILLSRGYYKKKVPPKGQKEV